MRASLAAAIRDAVPVPSHIAAAARACASDLLHGPRYARMPSSGSWKDFSEDDWAVVPSDLEGEVSNVYAGPVGNMLREFIQDMPSTLYADEDQEFVSTEEPTSEEIDGEILEASPYVVVEGRQIVEALFGPTISREFH